MESVAEAAAAAAGGAFSSAVLYPMEMVKNNLQAKLADSNSSAPMHLKDKAQTEMPTELPIGSKVHNLEEKEDECSKPGPCVGSEVAKIYKEKGVGGFYRGVQYSILESSLDKALYFAFYSGLKRLVGGNLSVGASLGLGYLSEAMRLPFSLPFETIATKLQTSENGTAYAIIQNILKHNGMSGFYKGWAAYIVLCLKPAIQYTVYEQLRKLLLLHESTKQQRAVTELTAVQAFSLGALSRAIATLVIFPYQRAKVLAMSNSIAEKGSHSFLEMASMLCSILKAEGFGGLYQGIWPEISRGVLSAALMLATKEKIGTLVKELLVPV